jgi:hypothetical protein
VLAQGTRTFPAITRASQIYDALPRNRGHRP